MKIYKILSLLIIVSISLGQTMVELEPLFDGKELKPSPINSILTKHIDLDISLSVVAEKKEILWRFDSFSEQGDILESFRYNYSDSSLSEQHIYNKQGNLLKRLFYNSDGTLTGHNSYKYDEYGNQIEWSILRMTGVSSNGLWKYEYDEQGNKTKELSYNSDGSLISQQKQQYKYDKQGNVLESFHYDLEGRLNKQSQSIYDQQNNRIKLSIYDYNGRLTSHYEYKYDDYGNRIDYSIYNHTGRLISQYKHKYDEQGSQIEESRYISDGSLYRQIKCEFEYDRYSNWTKKTCIPYKEKFGKFQPDYSITTKEITIRIIQYFE